MVTNAIDQTLRSESRSRAALVDERAACFAPLWGCIARDDLREFSNVAFAPAPCKVKSSIA